MWFRKKASLDYVKLMGRWASDRTVRLYINDGLAQLASMHYEIHKPPLQFILRDTLFDSDLIMV